jgi:hypothetical protein
MAAPALKKQGVDGRVEHGHDGMSGLSRAAHQYSIINSDTHSG